MSDIMVRNDTNETVTIQRNGQLGSITEYDKEGCFHAEASNLPLAAIPAKQRRNQGSWAKRSIKAITTAGALLAAASAMLITSAIEPIKSAPITSLNNGVTIHGAANSEAV